MERGSQRVPYWRKLGIARDPRRTDGAKGRRATGQMWQVSPTESETVVSTRLGAQSDAG
jgi:hypothetical protein